jgi:hypothetical protein
MMTATTDVDQQALCEAWTEVPGPPNTPPEQLLAENPGYFARVLDFTAHA